MIDPFCRYFTILKSDYENLFQLDGRQTWQKLLKLPTTLSSSSCIGDVCSYALAPTQTLNVTRALSSEPSSAFFKTENDFEQVLHQDRHAENSVGPAGPPQESKIGFNILLHVSVTIQEWLSSKSWSQRCWVVCVVSWYLLGGTQSSHLPRGLHGSGADQRNTLGVGSWWRALKVMLWESRGRETFINSDLLSLQDKYRKKCTGLGVLCSSLRTCFLFSKDAIAFKNFHGT